ncbi:hypothetical protein Mgra_00008356 [Meloidogyne graminicola]|uniref:Uncharacterized protein n=1 Tax=Meloidogyne graminicola TaxID=189291 RepID=A0A8S9ZFZ8_9BILA|nr:hypothetical protein Mgra_00008356 [Meloidogyne graminicola]KAF7632238.1 hypothetical protein Mgra_00008356 [Meloidogyne graminicola]
MFKITIMFVTFCVFVNCVLSMLHWKEQTPQHMGVLQVNNEELNKLNLRNSNTSLVNYTLEGKTLANEHRFETNQHSPTASLGSSYMSFYTQTEIESVYSSDDETEANKNKVGMTYKDFNDTNKSNSPQTTPSYKTKHDTKTSKNTKGFCRCM